MSSNLAYQDEFRQNIRQELIDGQVFMMSPRPAWNHNQVSFNIARLFANHLYGSKCVPIADGMDLFLTEKNHFVPDFMVVCDPDKIKADGVYGAPDLVVEVLSPSTAKNDRERKKAAYAQAGVKEYWIVSPNEKFVEVYRACQGEFSLHDLYTLRQDWELERMTEEERAEVVFQFQCSLFDDLTLSLEDIFYRTF